MENWGKNWGWIALNQGLVHSPDPTVSGSGAEAEKSLDPPFEKGDKKE